MFADVAPSGDRLDNDAAFEFPHAVGAWTEAALLKRVARVRPTNAFAIAMPV
jgi:hypothetical protein